LWLEVVEVDVVLVVVVLVVLEHEARDGRVIPTVAHRPDANAMVAVHLN
jgi:hypothetical protein